MAEFKNIAPGILNTFEYNNRKPISDRQDSAFSTIRHTMASVATPSVIPNASNFIGEVLYVFPDEASDKSPDSIASVLKKLKISENSKLLQIIARIPELHALIPIPKTLDDHAIIALFPVFTALHMAVEKPEVGDLVILDYKDKSSLAGPVYLGPLEGQQRNFSANSNGVNAGQASPQQAFVDASQLVFSPLPAIDSNFTRVVDNRTKGDGGIISAHDRFSESRMKKLDTIVFHQTADSRDSTAARPRLEAHIYVDRGGKAYIQYDFELYLPASHDFNSRPSVGIEFEGHMAGVVGASAARGLKNQTHWVPTGYYDHPERSLPQLMTLEQIEAGKQIVRYIAKYMSEKYGTRIKFIGTHRQTYQTKASDPGQDIMDKVAKPMMKELGLQLFPGTLRDGRPNPEIWGGQEGIEYLSSIPATKRSGWIRKERE